MNNNRSNNRRRGRGGNRQQGNQQINRIDSRARGNAPQLLEKYKKLAHDSHLNGDRVQEEYYLQFADHYFRVIADQRQRQDEARQRRDDRSQDEQDDRDDTDGNSRIGDDTERDSGRGYDRSRHDRDDDDDSEEGQAYEPANNPFIREGRSTRSPRPRNSRRDSDENGSGPDHQDGVEKPSEAFDASVLPPAIKKSKDEADADEGEVKPRRRTRRQPRSEDGGETLEAVN